MDLTAEHLKAPKAISISLVFLPPQDTNVNLRPWRETFKQAHRAQKGAAALGAALCGLRGLLRLQKPPSRKRALKQLPRLLVDQSRLLKALLTVSAHSS